MMVDIEVIAPLFNLPVEEDNDYCVRPKLLPDGFEDIGDGATRAVLRRGDLVFKIGDRRVCEREVANVERLRSDPDLPLWCYVPEAELVADVEVMERVVGFKPSRACLTRCRCGYAVCWIARANELMDLYDLDDLHRGNFVLVPDGDDDYIIAVYDLGDGSPEDWS